MIHLFVSADIEGNITRSYAGRDIVPPEEFDYSFSVNSWEIPDSIDRYKIANGELVLKEAPAE